MLVGLLRAEIQGAFHKLWIIEFKYQTFINKRIGILLYGASILGILFKKVKKFRFHKNK